MAKGVEVECSCGGVARGGGEQENDSPVRIMLRLVPGNAMYGATVAWGFPGAGRFPEGKIPGGN